jgi:hypothetical protein
MDAFVQCKAHAAEEWVIPAKTHENGRVPLRKFQAAGKYSA